MNNKTTTALVGVLAVIVVVLGLAVAGVVSFDVGGFGGSPGGTTTTSVTTTTEEPTSSVSTVMHTFLDPVNDTWDETLETFCDVANGDWEDNWDGVGCFDMPSGTFNETVCTTWWYTSFETFCEHEDLGATWYCDDSNVGCKR